MFSDLTLIHGIVWGFFSLCAISSPDDLLFFRTVWKKKKLKARLQHEGETACLEGKNIK